MAYVEGAYPAQRPFHRRQVAALCHPGLIPGPAYTLAIALSPQTHRHAPLDGASPFMHVFTVF
jgi:hypothetical protein